jgi:hypothetical protein
LHEEVLKGKIGLPDSLSLSLMANLLSNGFVHLIEEIVSWSQTGADRAGLDSAVAPMICLPAPI